MPHRRAGVVLTSWRLMLMLIAGGVMALVVVAVIGFSAALYTSQSTSPGNAFAAGSIDVSLASEGELVDAKGLLPGDVRSGQQTVTNLQHKAAVTLAVTDLTPESPLAAVLQVTVHQTDPPRDPPLWSGPLTDLARLDLGTFAAAEKRTYRVELDVAGGGRRPRPAGGCGVVRLHLDRGVRAVRRHPRRRSAESVRAARTRSRPITTACGPPRPGRASSRSWQQFCSRPSWCCRAWSDWSAT